MDVKWILNGFVNPKKTCKRGVLIAISHWDGSSAAPNPPRLPGHSPGKGVPRPSPKIDPGINPVFQEGVQYWGERYQYDVTV